MPTSIKSRIEEILGDGSHGRAAKVSKLRQLETDALARQRAGTEGMSPKTPGEGDDLKLIEIALRSLGEDAVDQGPASL